MNTEITDSISVMNSALVQEAETTCNGWMWASIVELLIILLLIVLLTKRRKNLQPVQNNLNELMDEKVDYQNIIHSSFNAGTLYNQLIKKCHPDRFPNDVRKQEIATEISAEAGKNKHNIKRLEELKQRAIQELNVKL